jgi:hypothetical protein
MRGEPGGDEGIPATNVEMDWIGLDWIGLDWIGLDWMIAQFVESSLVAAHTRFLLLNSYNTAIDRHPMRQQWLPRNSTRLLHMTRARRVHDPYV